MDGNRSLLFKSLRFSKLKVFILVALISVSAQAQVVSVRGRVDYQAPTGVFPMANAFVQMCLQNADCTGYTTGYDGMYYFQVSPGHYSVLVNGRLMTQIDIPDQQYFDIDPLLGN
jgi:hypothetical protein